jgi:predicted ATP-dependent endonuclease of OLD family
LGEGVQAIIILTYPLFFNKGKKANVYIEEPDVHLHPGYQRVLMETLLYTEGFDDFQFFFTTHSNHFLDMTLDYKDISIYKFDKIKENEFHITNIDSPDTTVLEAIGARNSSIFLTNCTLWVEGISDRIYIREFLKLYMDSKKDDINFKHYKEDIHYSFFEYAGNNITHYSFLDDIEEAGDTNTKTIHNINVKRLCGKVMVIAESDNVNKTDNSEKARRHQQLEEILGDRFIKLEGKEIENYLHEELIIQAVTKLNSGEKVATLKPEFKKFEKNMSISTWINDNIDHGTITAISKYNSPSKTLKNKAEFAQAVVKCITESKMTFSNLSIEAQKLAKKIYAFINENNK